MNYIATTACPDCGGSLEEIEVTDRATGHKVRTYGYSIISDHELPQSTRVASAGELKFLICLNCGRVLLTAEAQ